MEKEKSKFEYCKVCKLNHDEGKRHKYLPFHKKSLATLLSRFQTKITDIRFFLKNPTLLRPEHASRNRFWCIFCDSDIDELGSSFASGNAINHLASADHLKNFKHFMWKYGGGMDCVDNFRILEADIAKWERKCQSLKSGVASSREGSCKLLIGPSNDIHTEQMFENIDNFENNTVHPLKSNLSNGVVMPLQYNTNEYQVSNSGHFEVANIASNVASSLPAETCSGASSWNVNDRTVNRNTRHTLLSNSSTSLDNGRLSNGVMYQVYQHERMVNGESTSQGLQNITRISSMAPEEGKGNVNSGAPPPWFEATEQSQLNVQLKPVSSSFVSPSNKSEKSQKLNPKRVGAAWAERRKMEMEMEKKGEIVNSDCDASWLPNFGRVWQSGSRKESRKEFEVEKQKLPKMESHPEMPMKIQPYISKRMRRDVSE